MQRYRIPGFDKVMLEYFDIDHTETRKVLLSIDEADQNSVLTALTSRLYDNIVSKVDDIDYGDIPNTKGDITKLNNYDKIVDCIDIIKSILIEYKQETKSIDIISNALDNIVDRKELFEKGFRYQIEFVMITYSTIVLSIISSISFLIAACIEFIKLPSSEDFELVLNNVALTKTKHNLLFTNLQKFNASCDKGELDNCLNFIMKNNVKNFTGIEIGLAASGIAIMAILLNIIPIMRELIFFFYNSRTRVSDYFDIQADLLQMNAYNLQNNQSKDSKEKEKIVKKQLKLVDMFRKISNSLSITGKTAEVKATKELEADNTKYKTTDLLDSKPDSAASSALF